MSLTYCKGWFGLARENNTWNDLGEAFAQHQQWDSIGWIIYIYTSLLEYTKSTLSSANFESDTIVTQPISSIPFVMRYDGLS